MITEEYQKDYEKLCVARDEFVHNFCKSQGYLTERVCFVRTEIMKRTFELTDDFKPESIEPVLKQGKWKLEDLSHIVWKMTNTFNAPAVESNVYSDLLKNDDARSLLFEAKTFAKQTGNICKLIDKLQSKEKRLLDAIFGTNEPHLWSNLKAWVNDTEKYFDAVNDFSESASSDDLPGEVYERLEELNSIYSHLTILVGLETSSRIFPRKDPETIGQMEDKIRSIYQIAKIEAVLPETGMKLCKDSSDKFKAAVEEMAEILKNPDNYTGFHINHVTSGNSAYAVIGTIRNEDGRETQKNFGIHMTKQEAEKQAEKIKAEDIQIFECPTEEFYVVLHNSDNSRASGCVFETKQQALAVLYKFAKPDAFTAYQRSIEKEEKND